MHGGGEGITGPARIEDEMAGAGGGRAVAQGLDIELDQPERNHPVLVSEARRLDVDEEKMPRLPACHVSSPSLPASGLEAGPDFGKPGLSRTTRHPPF